MANEKNAQGIFQNVKPHTVMGYASGKSKEGRDYLRLDLFIPHNPKYAVGYGSRAVFLPDGEHHKATPDIIGKVAHCHTDMFGARSDFSFLD